MWNLLLPLGCIAFVNYAKKNKEINVNDFLTAMNTPVNRTILKIMAISDLIFRTIEVALKT